MLHPTTTVPSCHDQQGIVPKWPMQRSEFLALFSPSNDEEKKITPRLVSSCRASIMVKSLRFRASVWVSLRAVTKNTTRDHILPVSVGNAGITSTILRKTLILNGRTGN